MCIKMGHTHPLGVLHYSTAELVALFYSTEDMQCATHGALKATELQNEAITIRAVASLVTHVKAYIMTVHGDHSKPQSPPSEEEPCSPHDNPHPSGETLHCPQAELGNLTNHELFQLVEDLCQEITFHELTVPPEALHQCLGDTHQGVGMLKRVNQEVTFPRGGGWVPLGLPSPSPTPA